MKIKDISGKKFDRLTAIKMVYVKDYKAYWLFKCDCGKEITRSGVVVSSGGTKSCGCLHKEKSSLNGKNNKTHGYSQTRLYDTYRQMLRRCLNPSCKDYKNYGGRGISVYKKWMNIKTFFQWAIKSGYKDDLTIERIDVNKGYCPSNCGWVRNEVQAHNTRKVKTITYMGETNVLSYFAGKYGISVYTLIGRYNRGWNVDRMFSLPVSGRNQFSD